MVCAAVACYLLVGQVSAERKVEIDLSAAPGTTKIALAADARGISPGCGCLNPEFGKHAWEGMSVPSERFDIDVTSDSSDDLDPKLWALTAFAPAIEPSDWYGVPSHSLEMRVTARRRSGGSRTVFDGWATHMVLWSGQPVDVIQAQHNPYMNVLPADGGTTTFNSHESAREGWGGSVDISSEVPSRSESSSREIRHRYPDPELTKRGPMVDVLGPTDRFSVRYSPGMRLWAAAEEVKGLHPGDELEVVLSTPFSLRLVAHPVQLDWKVDLPGNWKRVRAEERNNGEWASLAKGPRLPGRFVLTEPLPPYSVELDHISIPDKGAWLQFSHRSAAKGVIPPMLGESGLDEGHLITGNYALPPVSALPQIGVFGKVTDLRSDSVRGRVIGGSSSTPIALGEELHLHSEDGLSAGKYHLTPLISSGPLTAGSTLSGSAAAWVDGEVLTHPSWWVLLPFSALVGALVGFLLAGILTWVHYGRDRGEAF